MGLDSVSLIMSFEDHFDIQFSIEECESILTVQQMADSIYEKIRPKPNHKCLSQIVFYRLRQSFESLGNPKESILPETITSDLIKQSNLTDEWSELESSVGLRLPALVALDLDRSLRKEVRFMGIRLSRRTPPITDGTLRDLTDWVIALNHEQLVPIEIISNRYDIERIICGIIEEEIGVPVNEVKMHHAFTRDLGID